jgi:hypothetical protein
VDLQEKQYSKNGKNERSINDYRCT